MYKINEVFETIQGEASYTGTPSIFLRLQGCPVGCSWCDTKQTWDVDNVYKVSLDETVEKKGRFKSLGTSQRSKHISVISITWLYRKACGDHRWRALHVRLKPSV